MKTQDLEIVRFTQPAMVSIIPRALFEQLVEFDPGINLDMLIRCAGAGMTNPEIYFFAFIDPEINKVVGFLWTIRNVIKNRLTVYYMSTLKEYQGGGIIHRFFELCKELAVRLKCDTTLELYSRHPAIAERYGGLAGPTKIYEFDITDPDYGKERRTKQEQYDADFAAETELILEQNSWVDKKRPIVKKESKNDLATTETED